MIVNHKKRLKRHWQLHKFQRELRGQLDELYRRRRRIQGLLRENRNLNRQELQDELERIEKQVQVLHLRMHLKNGNFNEYYRHIRYTRPVALIFNLTLWFLLFRFGGISTGLKIVILFMALMTTAGSIGEAIFLVRIRERILKPVENLRRGVEEIAQGNYQVEVANDFSNEMGTLTVAFNRMARKLKEDEELKLEYEANRKTLIANISHDLKTPITSVQGYLEALMERNDFSAEKNEKYLKIIYNNTVYLNKLIDDLFLFSKLDLDKLDFNFEPISIRPFFNDLLEEFRLDLEEKKVAFAYRDELDDEYTLKMDAKRIHQVVRNLIDNAIKYGSAKDLAIQARLYSKSGFVYLDICDNGPGISQEELKHVFERFYRAAAERPKDLNSTGLGLAIAKELVEAHGGKIIASSSERGTCFTLMLPVPVETAGENE